MVKAFCTDHCIFKEISKTEKGVPAYVRKPFCVSQSNIFHNNKKGKTIYFLLNEQVNIYIQTVIINMNTKYFRLEQSKMAKRIYYMPTKQNRDSV